MLLNYLKNHEKQEMNCNKNDKSKEKIYKKVCTKKLVLTAKVVKFIKMKRKRNCCVVIERKK